MKLFADLEMFHEANIPKCSLKHLFYAVCIPSFRSNHQVPRQVLIFVRFLLMSFNLYTAINPIAAISKICHRQRFKNSVIKINPWSYKKSISLTIFIHSWFRIIFRSISNNESSIAVSTFFAPYLDFKSLYCRNKPALT